MTDDLFKALVDEFQELQGGPFTYKAVQDGPLCQSIKKALDEAYTRGYHTANEEHKAKTKK